MSTPTISSTLARLVVGAACMLSTVSCGGELLRTGRSPVYLIVTDVTAGAEGGALTSFLLSDVLTNGSAFNDNVQLTLRVEPKNPSVALTAINTVTMTRYHVDFKRTDGRNRPGIDVPYSIDGALGASISTSGAVTFELVRHQAKREPPLANIAGGGGLRLLSTIAEITVYGRDQNGNELMATASIDVHFGDFGD
jgi:hypothetical protein